MPLKRPTTTPVPDEILDEHMMDLSLTELRVLLYIVRRTLGFGKQVDAISFGQFLHGIRKADGTVLDKGCASSRSRLSEALKSLEDRQLVRSVKAKTEAGDDAITLYALWWEDDLAAVDDPRARGGTVSALGSATSALPVVPIRHQGSASSAPTRNSLPRNSATGSPPTPVVDSKYTRGRYALCPIHQVSDCACPALRAARRGRG